MHDCENMDDILHLTFLKIRPTEPLFYSPTYSELVDLIKNVKPILKVDYFTNI